MNYEIIQSSFWYSELMRLYITRHARTNYNELQLCNSDPSVDVHLTEEGLGQAAELAEKLQDIAFERIIISNLPRTKQTADIINKYHKVPIEVDIRLTDNRTGFENQTYQAYEAAVMAAPNRYNFKGPDGESLNDVKARVVAFLDDLKQRNLESVLVVSHEIVIQYVVGILEELSDDDIWGTRILHGEYRSYDI